ncbi:MAG: Fic family protein [Halobacteriales archaeon]|nr:Fic family protein [Halobacteriales archaeon]
MIATTTASSEEYNLKYTGVNRHVTNPGQKVHNILQDADEKDDPYMKAATLLRRLPVLHVYEDGNKRTTWLTVADYLDRKELRYPDDPEQVEKVMKQIRSFNTEELAD